MHASSANYSLSEILYLNFLIISTAVFGEVTKKLLTTIFYFLAMLASDTLAEATRGIYALLQVNKYLNPTIRILRLPYKVPLVIIK